MIKMNRLLPAAIVIAFCVATWLPSTAVSDNLNIDLDLGGDAHEMVLDETRQIIYVSVPSLHEIVRVSAVDFSVIDRLVLASAPRGIDMSDDGSRLFAALYDSGSVAIIDLDALTYSTFDVADQLDDPRAWDVEYVPGERLYVSANPGSGGFAYIAQIDLALGTAQRVANNRIIRAAPVFAERDGQYLFVGEGFSPNSLYKLDLNQPNAPIVLEDDHGSVSGASKLEVSPLGERIHTTSGQVVSTASINQVALVAPGFTQYADDSHFYVAQFNNYDADPNITIVASFDTTTFLPSAEWTLPCPHSFSSAPKDFIALPDGAGFLILTGAKLCGLIGDNGALDADGDGVIDTSDNCPYDSNPGQENADGDAYGDVCDPYPADPDNLSACLFDAGQQDQTIEGLLLQVQQLKDELARLTDSDADGVPDVDDLCPGTRPRAKVDDFGCSRK
ncbi:MAG: thrombospondin type 3 repeat-containing protein, partial [Gammaproteobacteria bacterium]|nr:thrombospondin type 3 repeat-containing protein [Gammaproteobacteria bacterium]